MTQRFDELAAQRDPLYAEMRPVGDLSVAINTDRLAACSKGTVKQTMLFLFYGAVYDLTIRALRNQGQPYYTEAQQ